MSSTSTPLQLLEMAARLAGVGHWRFDVTSGKISWSSETYRIHGLPETEAEPDYAHLLDLYDLESSARLKHLVDRALATGEGYELEARIRRPDGTIRFVAAKAECEVDANGKVNAIIGVFQDVTERAQAARFMRTIANHTPAMVGYWDTDLRCRYANLQYLEWFGRSPAQMLGITIQELFGAELFAHNEPFIRRAMAGEAQTFERRLIKPSGEVGHTLARYIPDTDENGIVQGMIVLVTDVTVLKEVELRLTQATADANEARIQAQAAVAVKSEFLSNISHELRNPLTGIIGFSELLAGRLKCDTEALSHLNHIRDASAGLLRTVNDLLDFSRLEAGQVVVDPNPVDPCVLGASALAFFEPQLRKRGLSHDFKAAGGTGSLPAMVMADEIRVRQILFNLLGNAVKFTMHGGVTLEAAYDSVNSILRYDVVDSGPGILPEDQSKLFQRFSQVDASSTRKFEGAGLGLSICKGLAEAMGGRVGFHSVAGQGSRFWVELPCPPATMPGEHSPETEETIIAGSSLRGARLLVVDDHPANRELVKRIAWSFGIEAVEADGGAVAVELARDTAFDIILMDLLMPEMDGPGAARMIRDGAGASRAAKIIAFTAAEESQAEAAWSGLFNDRLGKPFAIPDLLNVLVRHLPEHRA